MRVFLLVVVILGGFLGAGFASGKEIVTYFSVFGGASYCGIALCTIVFVILLLFFFWLSRKIRGIDELAEKYFGKFGGAVKVVFAICIFILIATMFAGAWALGDAPTKSVMVVVITAVIVFLCNYFGFGGIGIVNALLVPIMIGMLGYLCIGDLEVDSLSGALMSSLSGVIYVLINMLTLGMFVLEVGHKYSQKEGVMTSIICGIIVGVLLFICNSGMLRLGDYFCDMPMLEVARGKGQAIYLISKFVVWFALLTSIVSNIYVLDSYLSGAIKSRANRLIIIILLSIILSFMGLGIMVKYMYLIIGFACLILVLVVSVTEGVNKKRRG